MPEDPGHQKLKASRTVIIITEDVSKECIRAHIFKFIDGKLNIPWKSRQPRIILYIYAAANCLQRLPN